MKQNNTSLFYSYPRRLTGAGQGNFSLNFIGSSSTTGLYFIRYSSVTKSWSLYHSTPLFTNVLIGTYSEPSPGNWIMLYNNQFSINLTQDINHIFIDNTELWFSVINDTQFFNSLN
jgi:hypothetical protein